MTAKEAYAIHSGSIDEFVTFPNDETVTLRVTFSDRKKAITAGLELSSVLGDIRSKKTVVNVRLLSKNVTKILPCMACIKPRPMGDNLNPYERY